jgi:hypothetical protein
VKRVTYYSLTYGNRGDECRVERTVTRGGDTTVVFRDTWGMNGTRLNSMIAAHVARFPEDRSARFRYDLMEAA